MAPRKTTKNKNYQEFLNFSRNYAFKPIEVITVPEFRGDDDDEDEVEDRPNPAEPQQFDDFIGQEQAKEVLKIVVDSANKEKRLIPNILLTGAYGHGKTTLAKLVAKRHRKKIQIIDGSVAGYLVKPDPNKIYIIDEAHNIPSQIADSFNILIDSGKLRIIACTTNPGALSAPFRSRFRSIYLVDYEPKDIARIITKAAKRSNIKIDKAAIELLSNRSKCNPRTALDVLDFVKDVLVLSGESEVTADGMQAALTKLGVDEAGLTNLDRKYLEILRYDRPVGLQYISSILALDAETVQAEIEPYLIKIGLIDRTPRGRIRVGDNNEVSLEERLKGMMLLGQ